MSAPAISCPHPVPRAHAQGITSVEVAPDQRSLTITLLSPLPGGGPGAADLYLLDPASWALTGGRRFHPRVIAVTQSGPNLVLHLDGPGDFSIYTLTVRGATIDPFLAAKAFSFKIDCEDPFDCRPPAEAGPAEPDSPAIDYLTKDYAGFRRLLLEQLPARLPDWTERSEADLGIALIELFAEAADRLSYYQDRVANEAFLGTATQRRSVQLHTSLVGYRMRSGAVASAYIQFEPVRPVLIAAGTQVQTRTQGDEPPVLFETGPGDVLVLPDHNALIPYTWGNAQCCIPAGATDLTVLGDLSTLKAGDAIVIADRDDPDRREIIVLDADATIVPPDPIKGDPLLPLTVLQWDATQALAHEYCLDAGRTTVSGNLVPATHGETIVHERLGEGDESAKRLRLALQRGPLSFVGTLMADGSLQTHSTLEVSVAGDAWEERETLIESGPFDRHYRIELLDDGDAVVVFGDGARGQKPLTGAPVTATYRIGIGPTGNVGRDSLTRLVDPIDGVGRVANPLPAAGGVAPETAGHARRIAPLRVQKSERLVTEADYEAAATEYRERGARQVQRARARFIWTGSWHTVFISVDPIGSQALTESLRAGLYSFLKARKLAGYDLEITPTTYVPLLIGLQVCARPDAFIGDVRAALLRALSNRTNPDGSQGFFHPDGFSFGDPVLLSRLYAAIEAVPGVDSVVVTRFSRLHQRDVAAATVDNLAKGFLPIGELEVARLDNDASFPENGRLTIEVAGGRQ